MSWNPQASNTPEALYGIWGSDSCNIWAVGHNGAVIKWNGESWSSVASGVSEELLSVWGSDARHVWIVGGGGTILHLGKP